MSVEAPAPPMTTPVKTRRRATAPQGPPGGPRSPLGPSNPDAQPSPEATTKPSLEASFSLFESLTNESSDKDKTAAHEALVGQPVAYEKPDGTVESTGWQIADTHIDHEGRKFVVVATTEKKPDGTPSHRDLIPFDMLRSWQPKPDKADTEPQDAEKDPADEANRKTDLELLGRSYMVRRAARKSGHYAMNSWDITRATARNIPSYAKHVPIALVAAIARSSYQNRLERQNGKHVAYFRLHQRIRDGITNRLKNWADNTENTRARHHNRINSRYTHALNRVERRAKHREGIIRGYVDVKAEKSAKQAVHQEMRENNWGFLERHAYTKTILGKPEHKRALVATGRLLREAEAVRRDGRSHERHHRRAERREHKLQERYDYTAEDIKDLQITAKGLDQSLYAIQTRLLPGAEMKLSLAVKKFSRATINDDVEAIRREIREAKNQITTYAERAETLQERKQAVQDELKKAEEKRAKAAGRYSHSQFKTEISSGRLSEHQAHVEKRKATAQAAVEGLLKIR